jgi:transposase
MIVIGADTHKQSHTVAAISEATGRAVADLTVSAKRRSFEDVLGWARGLESERVWAIEGCRHVSGALERFLLVRGERVVRVAPKLTARDRGSARQRGKSDRIDAVAIARAALREGLDDLPIAQLQGPELDVRLLVDHRERLIRQRTALINDLRWQLHDLWPEFEIPPRAPAGIRWQERVAARLARAPQTTRVKIARDELRRVRELTRSINALANDLAALVAQLAPLLLVERGCGVLTAAKLIGEIAGISRFGSDAKLARIAGAAPIPHHQDAPTAIASTAAATASSTARYTASRSAKPAWTPRPLPTSHASKPKATAAAKRCAASSATSPAASGTSSNAPTRSPPHASPRPS